MRVGVAPTTMSATNLFELESKTATELPAGVDELALSRPSASADKVAAIAMATSAATRMNRLRDGRGTARVGSTSAGVGTGTSRVGSTSAGVGTGLEGRIVNEDRPFESLEGLARLEPELFVQHASRILVRRQSLSLPVRAVQGEHELAPKPLAEGVRTDQRLELADQPLVAARSEISVDALLDSRHASLFETRDLGLCERIEGEVRECRAAPEGQSFEERLGCLLRSTCAKGPSAVFHEPLELVRVQLVRPDSEGVARTAGDENLLRIVGVVSDAERLSKLRDVDLDGLHGGRWRPTFPQLVDQPIDGDDFVSVEEEDSE